VLSDRGFCDEPITRPEGHTECGVSECDREASIVRRPWPTGGCCGIEKRLAVWPEFLKILS